MKLFVCLAAFGFIVASSLRVEDLHLDLSADDLKSVILQRFPTGETDDLCNPKATSETNLASSLLQHVFGNQTVNLTVEVSESGEQTISVQDLVNNRSLSVSGNSNTDGSVAVVARRRRGRDEARVTIDVTSKNEHSAENYTLNEVKTVSGEVEVVVFGCHRRGVTILGRARSREETELSGGSGNVTSNVTRVTHKGGHGYARLSQVRHRRLRGGLLNIGAEGIRITKVTHANETTSVTVLSRGYADAFMRTSRRGDERLLQKYFNQGLNERERRWDPRYRRPEEWLYGLED